MLVIRGLWAQGTCQVLFLLGVHIARPFSSLSGPWDGVTASECKLLLGLAWKSCPHNPQPPRPPPFAVKTLEEDVVTDGRSFDPRMTAWSTAHLQLPALIKKIISEQKVYFDYVKPLRSWFFCVTLTCTRADGKRHRENIC